jgi:hypothetical protein
MKALVSASMSVMEMFRHYLLEAQRLTEITPVPLRSSAVIHVLYLRKLAQRGVFRSLGPVALRCAFLA